MRARAMIELKPRPAPDVPAAEYWTYAEAFVYALATRHGGPYAHALWVAAKYAAREPRRRAALADMCAQADAAFGRGSPAAASFRRFAADYTLPAYVVGIDA
jgi:hypothetical protein